VAKGEAPWVVSIIYARRHHCGGVIIGKIGVEEIFGLKKEMFLNFSKITRNY
jgi:hypothetical protein